MKILAGVVAAVVLGVTSTYVVATTDGWYHDLYCAGKIDNLDPFCP